MLPRSSALLAGLASTILFVGFASPASAQDVELLGEIHGTRPPPAYFEEMGRDPAAFRFQEEGRSRLLRIQESLRGRSFHQQLLLRGTPALSLGPRSEPVVGIFHFPLVLGLFDDSPSEPAFPRERIQEEFFDGPNSRGLTLSAFYSEMSRGLVEIRGTSADWVRTTLAREEVTLNQSGLSSSRTQGVAAFIEAIVAELDARGIDWSRFDNTGDGFVDVLAVMHPTHGAECGGGGSNRIWSHRWSVRSASQGRLDPGIPTSTPRPDGQGVIYINDYTIQPLLACDATEINQIGVLAHELGHGFGLPDLYGTGGSRHTGSGNWDLMGTGSWGCGFASDPARPCHMGAWSQAMLGWVEVEDLAPDMDHGHLSLPPVASSGRVLRIPSVGNSSGEYLLLENRQREGSQTDLFDSGLLVWQVDPAVVDARWGSNVVNADPDRMGVRLREGDGRSDLTQAAGQRNRGSPGNPFPGCAMDDWWDYFQSPRVCDRNREFHAGSDPAAMDRENRPLGLTLLDIREEGAGPHDLSFRASTRLTRLHLVAEGAGEGAGAPSFQVNEEPEQPGPRTLLFAPFQTLRVEASPGSSLGEGRRVGFQGWEDGSTRIRTFTPGLSDSTLVATYGGREVRFDWAPRGPEANLPPGTLQTNPARDDLWFPEGSEVTVEAVPTQGFSFLGWAGELAGRENPLVLAADRPRELVADFDLAFSFVDLEEEIPVEAARNLEITFQVEEASGPVRWSLAAGNLPEGLTLNEGTGVVAGAAMESGAFPLGVRVRDPNGLELTANVLLDVAPPAIPAEHLTGPFLASGREPTALQKLYLDRNGNGNGRYDLGDLRVFVLAHPDLPAAAAGAGVLRIRVPLTGADPTPAGTSGGGA